MATFRATDFEHLERGLRVLDWSPWLADGVAPEVHVTTKSSKLYHTQAIADRVHRVIGPAKENQSPQQRFVIRIVRNTVYVRVDASGEALYRRPWRQDLGRAPLRPNMAAAVVKIAADHAQCSDGPSIDPFCGSGTILIEAAIAAKGESSVGQRSFAFQHWPSFQPGAWASVQGERRRLSRTATPQFFGFDRDSDQIAAARRNAERAGVEDLVTFRSAAIGDLMEQAGSGMVVSNPPFGKRVGRTNLHGLYRTFGRLASQRLPAWGLVALVADRRLANTLDPSLKPVARFRHGGLPVEVMARSACDENNRTVGGAER